MVCQPNKNRLNIERYSGTENNNAYVRRECMALLNLKMNTHPPGVELL